MIDNILYISNDNRITISIRARYRGKIAYAIHIDGEYKKTKVLPVNNTAIFDNFGYRSCNFRKVSV